MAKHRKAPARTLLPLATTGVAGAAMASTGLLMSHTSQTVRTPVELTSVQCTVGDLLCATGLGTPAAAATAVPQDIFAIFVGNGTMTHPDAGLLIGNGYSYTENDIDQPDSPCEAGKPCDGGNAGLLFGNGGNGWDGGSGGDAYLYGKGGNGGSAVDFGLASEDNFGGDGGHGGIFGGTDAAGTFFKGGGGDGGNGIHGGNGGDGGDAGWRLDLIPAVINRGASLVGTSGPSASTTWNG